jgi:hypothetical protein
MSYKGALRTTLSMKVDLDLRDVIDGLLEELTEEQLFKAIVELDERMSLTDFSMRLVEHFKGVEASIQKDNEELPE